MKYPLLFLLAGGLAANAAHGSIGIAQDNAGNAPYTTNNTWASGQNGGNDLGAWTLQASANGGAAGFFLASTAGNSDLNGIGTGANGNAWGTFANGGGTPQATAFRGFTGGPLTIGQAFRVSIENGSIANGGSVGFTLRTGNTNGQASDYNAGARFEFLFVGGATNYQIIDGSGTTSTGVPFTNGGLTVLFTLTGVNTYDISITPVGGSPTVLTNRTLGGTAGQGLDSFALYDRFSGTGGNAYFNSVVVVPEPTTWMAAAGLVGLVGWTQRRRFAR